MQCGRPSRNQRSGGAATGRGKGRRPPTRAQLRSQLRNEATVQLIELAAVLVTEEGRTVDRAELVEGGDWS